MSRLKPCGLTLKAVKEIVGELQQEVRFGSTMRVPRSLPKLGERVKQWNISLKPGKKDKLNSVEKNVPLCNRKIDALQE